MHSRISRLATAALFSLAACSSPAEKKLKELSVGIDRDSVLRVFGTRTANDSLPNVYRKEQYLLNGELTEILFYSPDGAKQEQDSTTAEATLGPVVLQSGKVTGWGWAYFDSVAAANNIRVRSPDTK